MTDITAPSATITFKGIDYVIRQPRMGDQFKILDWQLKQKMKIAQLLEGQERKEYVQAAIRQRNSGERDEEMLSSNEANFYTLFLMFDQNNLKEDEFMDMISDGLMEEVSVFLEATQNEQKKSLPDQP